MCGIAGIVREENQHALESDLRASLELMKERGPDHCATWLGGSVCLGHTRLSIIDLDDRSHQPYLVGSRVALTYNGEVYNFRQLKTELESKGHSFSTTSDTEVVAKGYLEWGVRVVERLDGMFAFALLDRDRNKLLLARDPFGQKPLYLFHQGREILFASDIRVIRKLKAESLTINLEALDYYFSEVSVPQPLTIWNEIVQLSPASLREIDLDTHQWEERRYWTLPRELSHHDEFSTLEGLEKTLVSAIKKRTVADVPLGCFLSGGVDSGLIVSMLASNSTERVRTFTVTVEGHSMDESAAARLVVDRYDTDHTVVRVKADLEEIARRMGEYCGEPFADSSVIPSFLVCESISKHLKVALSGDGGDEMFGGYREYLWAYKTDRFLRDERRSKFWKARVLTDKVLSRFSGRENMGALEHYSRFTGAQRMERQMGFSESVKRRLWKPEVRSSWSGGGEAWLQAKWDEEESPWLSDHLMRASLATRLVNDYLVKVDRTSMAHSLEVRSPFLDKSLAEFAFSISPELKFKGKTAKYLLKKLAEKYFDPKIFTRPKSGFSIPMTEWLMSERFTFGRDLLQDKDSWIYSLVEQAEVLRLWELHKQGQQNTNGLWSLICLEIWANANGLSR